MEESYFTVAKSVDGTLDVSRAPVQFTIVKPGETLLRPDEAETLVKVAQ
jgi:fumarate reductase flavoprotein subunit